MKGDAHAPVSSHELRLLRRDSIGLVTGMATNRRGRATELLELNFMMR
jgi:hypothetical protein